MAEIGTRPADFARWASGGAALVTEPSEPKKDVGWLPDEIPPAEFFNWLQERVFDTFTYFDARVPRRWNDLRDFAISSAAAGNLGLVDEHDPGWLNILAGYTNAVADRVVAACCDGLCWFLVVDTNADNEGELIVALDRSGTVIDSVAVTACRAIWSVGSIAPGGSVYTAEGNFVRVREHPDNLIDGLGTLVQSFDHGAAVRSVYATGPHVFYGGTANGTPVTHGRLNVADNWAVDPPAWTGNHGTIVRAVRSDGFLVWIGGDRDAGTPATLRRLDYSTGAVDESLDWGAGSIVNAIVTSKARVYACGDNGAGIGRVDGLGKYDLSSTWTAGSGDVGSALAFDGRRLFVGVSNTTGIASIRVLDPETGFELHAQSFDHGAADVGGDVNVLALATDGFALFAGGDRDTSDRVGWRHNIRAMPALARRMSATDRYREPWHIGVLPAREEEV